MPLLKGPQILANTDPGYREHAVKIADLQQRALRLGLIQKDVATHVMGQNGIICDAPTGASVASAYASGARTVTDEMENYVRHKMEKDIPEQLEEKHVVIREILALHLYLQQQTTSDEKPQDLEKFLEQITALEKFCRKEHIPSFFPDLLHPASLHARQKDTQETLNRLQQGQRRFGLHNQQDQRGHKLSQQLAGLCQHNPTHLNAVINPLFALGKDQEALSLIDKVAQWKKMTQDQLFAHQPLLLDSYTQYLFSRSEHDAIISLWQRVQPRQPEQCPNLTISYVKILLGRDLFADAKQCIESHTLRTTVSHSALAKNIAEACLLIGWWMYGQATLPQHFVQAKAFLHAHAPNVLRTKNFAALLDELDRMEHHQPKEKEA